MVIQETGDVVWGHINGVLASNSRGVTVSGFAIFGTVCYFLVTDMGLMSFDFVIEAFVIFHELLLFGIRMCLPHSVGVDVHSMSSLGGGVWSRSSVSSILVVSSLVLFRCQSEGFVESLFLLTELGSSQPFLIRLSGLIFPFFESPWGFHIWVKIRGLYNYSGEWSFHSMFESFYSSLVI